MIFLGHKMIGVVVSATEKSKGHGLLFNGDNGQLAMVGTQLTGFPAHGKGLLPEIKPPESTLCWRLILEGQGHPQCPGEVTIGRYMDGFFQPLFKGRHQGSVFGRGSLEEDGISDPGFGGHLGHVIIPHRMQGRCQHLIHAVPLGQKMVHIPLHEYGAAITGDGGTHRLCSAGILGKGTAQL